MSKTPTITGPIQSPTFPDDRCNDMKNPLRLGKRCERIPNDGGCQSALPAEAITRAASISKYVGEIATNRYPIPINSRLKAKASPLRC